MAIKKNLKDAEAYKNKLVFNVMHCGIKVKVTIALAKFNYFISKLLGALN